MYKMFIDLGMEMSSEWEAYKGKHLVKNKLHFYTYI